ncbi:MAG TPA: hypothetical protein VNA69_18615 [Thermoanaerobaculia bacterium]|nr:hypothetical protein [Thermoanaerobaculia bacterium]
MDPFSAIETGEKTYKFFKVLRALPVDLLSRLFAYVIAPVIVGVLSWFAFGRPGTLFAPEYALTVTELASYTETGIPQPHSAVAMLVEPSRYEYAVPMEMGKSRRLVTSLTPDEWRRNSDKLAWAGSDLALKLPLLGVSRPIMVLADGKVGKELLVAGGKIPVDRLQIVARRSVNMVTWAFVSAIFGIGLGVASDDAPVRQNSRRQNRRKEDEDEIVDRHAE